jgi:hypothetical protein
MATTSTFSRGENLPPFLDELFYGEKGADGRMCLRSNKTTGLTRSCYVAEKLFIVRYVLMKFFDFDYYKHSPFESVVIAITGQYNKYAATKYFEDQNPGEKLIEYVESQTPRVAYVECSERLKHLTYLFSSQLGSDRSTILDMANIEKTLKDSYDYPIPMAFGYDPAITRGPLYEIDHWFVLYQGRLYGATGFGTVEISFYGSDAIDLAEFRAFLKAMNENYHPIFDAFLIKHMFPESHSVTTFKPRPRNSKNEDEDPKPSHIRYNYREEIAKILAGYKDLTIYKFYILNGYHGETYVDTMRIAINCLSTLPTIKSNFINVIPPKRAVPLSEDKMSGIQNPIIIDGINKYLLQFKKIARNIGRMTSIIRALSRGRTSKIERDRAKSRSRSRSPLHGKKSSSDTKPTFRVGGSKKIKKKKRAYKTRKYRKKLN